jgi:hypothetical protein
VLFLLVLLIDIVTIKQFIKILLDSLADLTIIRGDIPRHMLRHLIILTFHLLLLLTSLRLLILGHLISHQLILVPAIIDCRVAFILCQPILHLGSWRCLPQARYDNPWHFGFVAELLVVGVVGNLVWGYLVVLVLVVVYGV